MIILTILSELSLTVSVIRLSRFLILTFSVVISFVIVFCMFGSSSFISREVYVDPLKYKKPAAHIPQDMRLQRIIKIMRIFSFIALKYE